MDAWPHDPTSQAKRERDCRTEGAQGKDPLRRLDGKALPSHTGMLVWITAIPPEDAPPSQYRTDARLIARGG